VSTTGPLGAADLHIHSDWSDGLATVPAILAHAEANTDLDVVAIADHDQVRGALEAVEWCAGRPGGRLQSPVATEISTAWGRHLVALFFAEPFPTAPFPRFRSLHETVARVHDAGGIVVLPHPFSALVPSVGERTLTRLLRDRATHPALAALQGLEVCCGATGGRRLEVRLRRQNARKWRLATLGSSDAHHLIQVGLARTRFPGRTLADLRRAIAERTAEARWGPAGAVSLSEHARQGWVSLVVKPAREVREALSRGPGRQPRRTPPPSPAPSPAPPAPPPEPPGAPEPPESQEGRAE
jgi:predicted metal-dependent phosphoesterase TrpH